MRYTLATAFDRLFDDAYATHQSPRAAALTPACDLAETDAHFFVTLDMPGVAKDDIKIEVIEGQLKISAQRKHDAGFGNGSRRLAERGYGLYQRAFSLGNAVDLDGIQAVYRDGVLRVALPKAAAAKPRNIQIDSEDRSGVFSSDKPVQ